MGCEQDSPPFITTTFRPKCCGKNLGVSRFFLTRYGEDVVRKKKTARRVFTLLSIASAFLAVGYSCHFRHEKQRRRSKKCFAMPPINTTKSDFQRIFAVVLDTQNPEGEIVCFEQLGGAAEELSARAKTSRLRFPTSFETPLTAPCRQRPNRR
jgi:hypothetical protein